MPKSQAEKPSTTVPSERDRAAARDLCAFIDRSPTPYHAAAEAARRLSEAGFSEVFERDVWRLSPGDKRYVIRGGGTLVAFVAGTDPPSSAGFRMIGAHTDSPNLRVKPQAEAARHGYRQVGVEVYGGALYSTWLDRDLSLAGRVLVRKGKEITPILVEFRRPIARVANLAIHLNRSVNSDGLVLNAQKHLPPILGLGKETDLLGQIGSLIGESAQSVLGYDLMFHDTAPSSLLGLDEELICAPRLDNLGSCHAAIEGLLRATAQGKAAHTRVVVLYDHEECGSKSAAGAAGTVLKDTLSRIVAALPEKKAPGEQAFTRAMAGSYLVSADMAHALHPNYADQHEPGHQPALGKGLVIKSNSNQSYATNGETAARFSMFCEEAGYKPQHFVVRSDLPCGSTIGSITAAELGVGTVDVGAPMLSMHSCREMAGTADVSLAIETFRRALR